jgi:hypothetical protein
MEILEDQISMGDEVKKKFELVHCNVQVDKLFGTNFSLIDGDKEAFIKSQYLLMEKCRIFLM